MLLIDQIDDRFHALFFEKKLTCAFYLITSFGLLKLPRGQMMQKTASAAPRIIVSSDNHHHQKRPPTPPAAEALLNRFFCSAPPASSTIYAIILPPDGYITSMYLVAATDYRYESMTGPAAPLSRFASANSLFETRNGQK